MALFDLISIILVVFVCFYALAVRICQCIEHCATADAFAKFSENGVNTSFEKVHKSINKTAKNRMDI